MTISNGMQLLKNHCTRIQTANKYMKEILDFFLNQHFKKHRDCSNSLSGLLKQVSLSTRLESFCTSVWVCLLH